MKNQAKLFITATITLIEKCLQSEFCVKVSCLVRLLYS